MEHSIFGHIFDGNPETPVISALLEMNAQGQKNLKILIETQAQMREFSHALPWLNGSDLPESLEIKNESGVYALYGLSHKKSSINFPNSSYVILGVTDILSNGSIVQLPELMCQKVRSSLECLNSFFEVPTLMPIESNQMDKTINLSFAAETELREWRVGNFVFKFILENHYTASNQNLNVKSRVILETTTENQATLQNHLVNQNSIFEILQICTGQSLSRIKYKVFNSKLGHLNAQGNVQAAWHNLETSRLLNSLYEDRSEKVSPAFWLLPFTALTEEFLTNATIRRAELVRLITVTSINIQTNRNRYADEILLSSCIGLEFAGKYLDNQKSALEKSKESDSIYKHIFACLSHLNLANELRTKQPNIAHFIANTYNALKHPERVTNMQWPSELDLIAASMFASGICRGIFIGLVTDIEESAKDAPLEIDSAMNLLVANHRDISESGYLIALNPG